MSAAIEYGVAKPDDVLNVPGSIRVADRTINDAWRHGLAHYTLTGVLAKSSNVGTIMTAQKVGPERFADMLSRYRPRPEDGVGLPGESPGSVPLLARRADPGSARRGRIGRALSAKRSVPPSARS